MATVHAKPVPGSASKTKEDRLSESNTSTSSTFSGMRHLHNLTPPASNFSNKGSRKSSTAVTLASSETAHSQDLEFLPSARVAPGIPAETQASTGNSSTLVAPPPPYHPYVPTVAPTIQPAVGTAPKQSESATQNGNGMFTLAMDASLMGVQGLQTLQKYLGERNKKQNPETQEGDIDASAVLILGGNQSGDEDTVRKLRKLVANTDTGANVGAVVVDLVDSGDEDFPLNSAAAARTTAHSPSSAANAEPSRTTGGTATATAPPVEQETLLDERTAGIAACYQHESLILADSDQSALKVRRKLSVLEELDIE